MNKYFIYCVSIFFTAFITFIVTLLVAPSGAFAAEGGVALGRFYRLIGIIFLLQVLLLIVWLVFHIWPRKSTGLLIFRTFIDLFIVLDCSFVMAPFWFSNFLGLKQYGMGLYGVAGLIIFYGNTSSLIWFNMYRFSFLLITFATLLYILNYKISTLSRLKHLSLNFIVCLTILIALLTLFEPRIVGPVTRFFIVPDRLKQLDERGYEPGSYIRILRYFGYLEYEQSITPSIEHSSAYYHVARDNANEGNFKQAASDYNKAIELSPINISAYRELAWILSTCPDSAIRDGKRATQLANRAFELSGCQFLDLEESRSMQCDANYIILAASYAEIGNFQDALKTHEKALSINKTTGRVGNLSHDKILASYRSGLPWRSDGSSVYSFNQGYFGQYTKRSK